MNEYLDCRRMRLGKNLEEATKVLERMALNRQGRQGLPWDGTIYLGEKPVRTVDDGGTAWDLNPIHVDQFDGLTCQIIDGKPYLMVEANRELKQPKQEFDPFEL